MAKKAKVDELVDKAEDKLEELEETLEEVEETLEEVQEAAEVALGKLKRLKVKLDPLLLKLKVLPKWAQGVAALLGVTALAVGCYLTLQGI